MSTAQPPTAAPQASGASAASSSAQAPVSQSPALPPRSVSRPASTSPNTNATSNANTVPTPATQTAGAPIPGPTATPAAAPPATTTATPTDDSLSFNEKLNVGDRYWKFKFAGMAILVITGLVGIGCIAWLMASRPVYDGYGSYWGLWPTLVTWSISIAWCAICAIIFVVRKRPVHPGVRVSMELLLWLSFIVTALFALFTLQSLMDYGLYGGPDSWGYDYGSSDGDYVLAPNNTWVWEPDSSYVSGSRDCSGMYSVYSELNFSNCAEQDAFINKLWAEKPHRVDVNMTAVVCQFFGLALHFALFVWACVDCHRYNRTKVSKDAERIAAGIVQTMINNGAIVPPPGQAFAKPGMAQGMYYQVPPQGYSMQPMYMQQAPGQHQPFGQPQQMGQQPYMVPRQYPMGQPPMTGPAMGAPGPSNEKGAGPRYA
ncbi:hypothetical protein DDE82_007587 [Stemphylium lycopersici]|uniref:Uncharacterized protein n=1 Tax=Stemphylium lycopersici TaxID=183478 RepID=A0A364NDH2_STELY|nr:hypothetical protein TW65_07487 [Stemphylium lycopersici]RAR00134.1 hypothetical protein DDE82_007587 [Stemphylium lycopersici]RAR15312.1 hypothetical protein DDE83_001346 [Stemphylium lycopersici]